MPLQPSSSTAAVLLLSEAESSNSSFNGDCGLQDTDIESPLTDPASEVGAITRSSEDDRIDLSQWRSSSAQDSISLPQRVCLHYSDEGVRDRFCANAERLLKLALEPHCSSTDALLARKALRYRKVLPRLRQVDHRDPTFDVSSFFGIEWRRKTNAKRM
jgi:hypothetical protein